MINAEPMNPAPPVTITREIKVQPLPFPKDQLPPECAGRGQLLRKIMVDSGNSG
jgi:hypothetical protein